MRLKSIKITNILSIEKLELEFSDMGLVLLDGWNFDDNSGNGAGKTSIWNALSFCLYGKFPREISLAQILRRKAKKGSVVVELEVNGKSITIERHRPKKEIFTVDGQLVPNQEALNNHLGLTYDQFLMCMYVSQMGSGRFLDLKDSDKKQFFLNLISLTQFDDTRSTIEDKISDLTQKLNSSVSEIEKCDIGISAYRDNLEDEDLLLEQLKKYSVEDLETKLQDINTSKPDTSEIDNIKSQLLERLDTLHSSLADISLYHSKLSDIDQRLSILSGELTSEDHIECPNCHSEFILAGENSLTIDQHQKKINDRIMKLQNKRLELIGLINNSPSGSDKGRLQELIKKTTKKRDDMLSEYFTNKERYTEIKSKIELRKSKSQDVLRRIEDSRTTYRKIEKLEDKKIELSKLANKLNSEISVCKTLSTIFSSTGVQAYVLDSVIDIFNSRVSDYVSFVWPNAQYTLLSYKENKSGEIKAKLSDKLIISGEDVSIGSLSGGELNCLCLSIDLAVVEVMEFMSGTRINPYILDEPFKDLDTSNRERAIGMLEKAAVNRQIWIVDHGSEAKAMFSDIVKVEKRNGVSKIV